MNGRYKLVSQDPHLTYLTTGDVYDASTEGNTVRFQHVVRGSGTFEKLSMLRIFERQGRIQFEELK